MALLTTNVVPNSGLQIDNLFVSASSGGDTCATGAGVALHVKNGSESSVTVTVAYPRKYDGDQTVSGRQFTVPAAGEYVFPMRDIFRDPSTGVASITYSSATSVEVAVIRGQAA